MVDFNFDNIPMLITSEEFRKDITDILLKDISSIKSKVKFKQKIQENFSMAIFYLATCMCADKNGRLKATNEELTEFMNNKDKIKYVLKVMSSIIDKEKMDNLYEEEYKKLLNNLS